MTAPRPVPSTTADEHPPVWFPLAVTSLVFAALGGIWGALAVSAAGGALDGVWWWVGIGATVGALLVLGSRLTRRWKGRRRAQ